MAASRLGIHFMMQSTVFQMAHHLMIQIPMVFFTADLPDMRFNPGKWSMALR